MSGTDLANIGATGGITGSCIRSLSSTGLVAGVGHNEGMSTARDLRPPESRRPEYLSSVVALAFGVVLAVGVSALFGLLGWGGELASQTAGAASGAAPLILDGIRQRRARPRSRPSLRAMSRGVLHRYNKLWIASAFAFAVILVDSAAGLGIWRLSRFLVRVADGDPSGVRPVYTALGAVVTLPVVFVSTYLFAVAAGHRLGDHRRRWLLLAMSIYGLVRIAMVLPATPSPDMVAIGLTKPTIVLGLILTIPLMAGIALLGGRRARTTQTAFYAQLYFRRLSPADQEAALALLDETVTAPPVATPPAAAPRNAAGSSAPPPAPRGRR
jgi:hypothetical protein